MDWRVPAHPLAINLARGWLSSWNSKFSLGYPNPDREALGQWRSLEIDERLANGLISLNDMKDIAKDIARTDQGEATVEKLAISKPQPLECSRRGAPVECAGFTGQGRAQSLGWQRFWDPIAATTREAGQVIFAKWLEVMRVNTFSAMNSAHRVSQASTNMLDDVLDDAWAAAPAFRPAATTSMV